ncbi:hypothetical protein TRVA0_018S00562 [Trichomonascus vanleenenianus]|uniref:PalH/RIM21 family protein n=1 Tax=Trichomonascus vanleenenianus TaxID=2268995 RepID=UPI003ECB4F15
MSELAAEAANDDTVALDSGQCERYAIPPGVITYVDGNGDQQTLTITNSGLFIVNGCTEGINLAQVAAIETRDPFYGSVAPIAYTSAATTVMSWLLLLLLFVSQKKRPWLQKIATLGVAVTLTASLAAITSNLEEQYNRGYQDADELRQYVYGGIAFQILMVISSVALWMAHIQVTLKLFQTPREKHIIYATGAVLVITDAVLQCCSDFVHPVDTYSERFSNGLYIATLVVELVIVTIYALAVILYTVRKRKYAYSWSTFPVATLSLAAMISPLVFNILGMASYWFAAWTGFASRVCSAASNVVVWDWLDAIERRQKEAQQKAFMGKKLSKTGARHLEEDTNEGTSSGGSGSNDNCNSKFHVFPLFQRRKWIIDRGGSANSGQTTYLAPVPSAATTIGESNNIRQQVTQPPPAPASPLAPQSSPSVHSTSSSLGDGLNHNHRLVNPLQVAKLFGKQEKSLERHVHPLNSRRTRTTPQEELPLSSARSTHSSHSATPSTHSRASSVNMSDNRREREDDDEEEEYTVVATSSEPPPEFFPHRGFEPGDYWDDKAPPPSHRFDNGSSSSS